MASTATAMRPPDMENFIIGIIGMGDMGKMYARRLSDAGWK
jgi:prephenate dehydrogenase (NADP+)